MKHILFMTMNGPYLVSVCVDKNVDIEDVLKERALHEKFENKSDVKVFMNKYISDESRPDYRPYWQFVDIDAIV